MTWLIVALALLGYAAISAEVYLVSVPIRYRHHCGGQVDGLNLEARAAARSDATYMALNWPVTVIYQVCRAVVIHVNRLVLNPLRRRAIAPVTTLEARVPRLRAEAQAWQAQAANPDLPDSERRLAADLARLCDELVGEVSR